MSAFDGARNDDVGADALWQTANIALDTQIRRRDPWPERAMRLLQRWFWAIFLGMLVTYVAAWCVLG
jgi:hypothetical protein